MKWLVSGTDNDDDVLDTFMYAYVLCIVIQQFTLSLKSFGVSCFTLQIDL